MKSIVVFYDQESEYSDEKVFNGKTVEEISEEWASSLTGASIHIKNCADVSELLNKICIAADENQADYVIYSYSDLPFLNKALTEKIIKLHLDFKAEYTFADGYPYGFSPEVIDKGTLHILNELAKTNPEGKKPVTRESIFNVIKTDINSFDVESVLADEDWRLLRYSFDCSKKENYIACKCLLNKISKKEHLYDYDVNELSEIASKEEGILKTVPGFYNIQITDKTTSNCKYSPYNEAYEKKYGINPFFADKCMKLEDFKKLVKLISDFSGKAVVNLSAWGECFANPHILDFVEEIMKYEGLSVFIETDGSLITEEICEKLKIIYENAASRTNGYEKIMIAVCLDSFTAETYNKIRGVSSGFDKAVSSIKLLGTALPGCVYPQFVRMLENENELESFYRFWNEKTNPSGGNLIIQKYDYYSGLLPDCKSADLSPVDRNVCWHLRRDMTILTDGSVPLCKEFVLNNIMGNVFAESLEEIWEKFNSTLREHISCNYSEKCRKCDEFYTYNF